MKEINLEEIANYSGVYRSLMNEQQKTATLVLMKEAIKQALELAAENSKIEIKTVGEKLIIVDVHQEDNYTRMQVNLPSILDTINQIK